MARQFIAMATHRRARSSSRPQGRNSSSFGNWASILRLQKSRPDMQEQTRQAILTAAAS